MKSGINCTPGRLKNRFKFRKPNVKKRKNTPSNAPVTNRREQTFFASAYASAFAFALAVLTALPVFFACKGDDRELPEPPVVNIANATYLYMDSLPDFAKNTRIADDSIGNNPKKRIYAEVRKDIGVRDSAAFEALVGWNGFDAARDSVSTDWKGYGMTTGSNDTLILNPARYNLAGKPPFKGIAYARNLQDSTDLSGMFRESGSAGSIRILRLILPPDTVYYNINTLQYLTDSIAAIERQATAKEDSLKRLDITLGALAIAEDGFDTLAVSLNKLRAVSKSERVIRFDSTAFAISPAAAGILITYGNWEKSGFPKIAVGAGGIKFEIPAKEASLFAERGVGEELVIIRPAPVAEVEISGPNDFAEKAQLMEKYLADGYDSVRVILRSNIPANSAVMGILNQKKITDDKVVWTDAGAGAFVPATADQEVDGNLFANLPIGRDGNKWFYITGKNGANRITHFKGNVEDGIFKTDTVSTSRMLGTILPLRAQKGIYVDIGRAGTGEDPIDARNFDGYERTNDPAKHIPVIVQEGKQLAIKGATVKILERFQTDVVQGAYNYGYTGNENYIRTGKVSPRWINMEFGPNGPLQLVFPNNPISNPNLSWEERAFGQLYDNLVIKSMHIGKNDIIYEAGHFENGKDVSNSVLNMLEISHLLSGPIDFTIEGDKIDIRWTNFSNLTFDDNGGGIFNRGSPRGWEFVKFVPQLFKLKEHGIKITVTDDWCIITPSDVTVFNYDSWHLAQPSPEVKNYMLDKFNIDIGPRKPPNTYNSFPFIYYQGLRRIPGGWDWYINGK
ncbi:MAG: hypothetical protein LBE91_04000 [Tannerella sp.]|jgi:hypothetical protein|nr:hypothetical protein [Tannerella sp.]